MAASALTAADLDDVVNQTVTTVKPDVQLSILSSKVPT